jgi:hypothetical protein
MLHTNTEPQAKLVLYILIFIFVDSRQEDRRFWTEWYKCEMWGLIPRDENDLKIFETEF